MRHTTPSTHWSNDLQRVYELAASPVAVEAMIRDVVDTPNRLYGVVPGAFRGRRFVGQFRSHGFEISVRRRTYNSFAPQAVGRIDPIGNGCRVSVKIGVPRVTRLGLSAIIGATALGSLPILLSLGYGFIALLLSLALLGLLGLVLHPGAVDTGFPRSEAAELRQFLDSVLAG